VEKCAPNSENDQGNRDKDNKHVKRSHEAGIPTDKGDFEAKRPDHQIEQADLNDNKAPEGEKVCNARDWIAQHAALAQHDLEERANAVIQVVGAVLAAASDQQHDQLARTHGKNANAHDEQEYKEQCADPIPGW
jgi:hypothetical protein